LETQGIFFAALLFYCPPVLLWEFCPSNTEANGSIMKFCLSPLLLDFSVHENFTGTNQTAPHNGIDIMGLHQ
jgi:hypothetical protein